MPSTDGPSSTTLSTDLPDIRPHEAERGEGLLGRLRQRLGLKTAARLRENLEEVLDEDSEASAEGAFSLEERSMLRSILDLKETRIADIMVPRADMSSVQKDVPLADLMEAFEASGKTRLVVYDDTLDDPVGMVHIKDLLAYFYAVARRARNGDPEAPLSLATLDLTLTLAASGLIRPVLFAPPSMPVLDLLQKMQASHIPLALVIDEYGGTEGLLAIKDIVETIVGDIEDEHDNSTDHQLSVLPDGRVLADARILLEDLREHLDETFQVEDEMDEDIDTLGGLLTSLAGHVPVRGEVVAGPGDYEFEVLDADPRRVKRVRITKRLSAPPADAEA